MCVCSMKYSFVLFFNLNNILIALGPTHQRGRRGLRVWRGPRGLTSALTLSVGEVEEQTQGEQQRRQQQRGSGSVHGGTAWHQHALAASVALAHRAL